MKKTYIFLFVALMLVAVPASAAVFNVGDIYEHKADVVIYDDLYVAGGLSIISGDVRGDVMVVGGEVSLLGNVTEDISAIGGAVDVIGSVGGDLRVVGGRMEIASRVTDDLVAVGGLVHVLSDAVIVSDATIVAGATFMSGKVNGDLTIYGDEVEIDGTVRGNVVIKYAKKVTIGEGASIVGNLTYSAKEEIEIPSGAFVGGKINFTETPTKNIDFGAGIIGILALLFAIKFMLLLTAGLVAVLVFKKFSKTIVENSHNRFAKNVLIGFITLLVVPVAAVLIIFTMLGAYVGAVILGAYALMLSVAKVYAGIVAGAFLSKWIKKEVIVNWKWAVLGIVALQALCIVPIIGALVYIVFMLSAFGSIGVLAYNKMWLNR